MSADSRPAPHIPRATYRLQLTPDFGFAAARRLVPYLQRLGISDIYCSPILTARHGSTHGYDVIDPLHINPALGGDAAFERLARDAARHGLRLLIDIVPNHMAASIDNPWWYDVLEHGRSSRYAHFFDIEWEPPDPNESLHNRVLLPILGAPYGETLENGEIQITGSNDGYELRYFEHRLPIALEAYALILEPSADALGSLGGAASDAWVRVQHVLDSIETLPPRDHFDPAIADRRRQLHAHLDEALAQLRGVPAAADVLERRLAVINGTPGMPRSFDLLDRIVRRQAYRLAFWQIAREQINYRRFFDINDLVSLRVEDDDVFDTVHQRILGLARSGLVAGLRVDHIDGLRDPGRYLTRLRTLLDQKRQGDQESRYLVVEKILAANEALPADWPVSGTTGYDLLNLIGDLFVDVEQLPALDAVYRRVSGETDSFEETQYRAKRELLETTFAAYVRSLAFDLAAVSNSDRHGRDLTFEALQQVLIEVTAALPIYRTYVNELAVSERDRAWIEQAINAARGRRPDLRHSFDFLQRVLMLDIPGYVASRRRSDWLDVVMRWQQLSGPVMAKGNEDTALYRSYPLSSRNEVGSHLNLPPVSIDEAHVRFATIAREWPHTMIASSTHDTKRSEDVRARIAVLSEMPGAWEERLTGWQRLNTDKRAVRDARPIPDGNVEYLIYQTMLGAWPFDPDEFEPFHQRLSAYIIKAVREAKVHSSWVEPDTVYEETLSGFVDALFDRGQSSEFLSDFTAFQQVIARAGALNALSQTLIKLTAPGIPDIYQGTELWDLSLVDPDNRRPVDYDHRAQLLDALNTRHPDTTLLRDLTTNWHDGRIKLFLLRHALGLRRRHPALFAHGRYTPIAIVGERRDHLFSFVRTFQDESVIAVAPRRCASILDDGKALMTATKWGDSTLALPGDWSGPAYNILTGDPLTKVNVQGVESLMLTDVFRHMPVGLIGNEPMIERAEGE